ncbi:MAG TPA: glycosyltransferase family 4 protein [Anaerolineales bacterium]|nr:glycosyltransferase family 4 protein [Anaerolineales bacterium]
MAKASILSIEPFAGGVPRLTRAIYDLLVQAGHTPQVVYTDAESTPTRRAELLPYFLRHPLPHRTLKLGMDCLAIPRYPVSFWQSWHLPHWLARGALSAPIRIATSGAAHTALAYLPSASRLPFVVWLATVYEDELIGRADRDAWAAGILADSALMQKLRHLERQVLDGAARVWALSEYTAERLVQFHPTVSAKMEVMPYPIDTTQLAPAVSPPAERNELIFVSRLQDPRKNIPMLLHAFALAQAQRPELRLVLVGDTPTAHQTLLAEQLGIRDKIDFAGKLSETALRQRLQTAALFVLPSHQEGLGIAAMEGMACGLPVVSTRCGGPEATISASGAGILVENDNPTAFAQAILRFWQEPNLRPQMSESAVKYVAQTLSVPAVQAKMYASLSAIFPSYFSKN